MTGVPPDVWAREGARAMATAFEVLEEIYRQRTAGEPQGYDGDDAPQMSG